MVRYFIILTLILSIGMNCVLVYVYREKRFEVEIQAEIIERQHLILLTTDSILHQIDKDITYLKIIENNYSTAMDSLRSTDYVLRTYFSGESLGGG